MRRAATAVALLLALTAVPTIAAAKHHRRPVRCERGQRGMIVANGAAQVYGGRPGSGIDVFACAFGSRRIFDLGLPYECGGGGSGCAGVRKEVVAGPVVAYEVTYAIVGHHVNDRVLVRDLRTGRLLHSEPTAASSHGLGWATDIVVKSDGAVAWIAGLPWVPESGPVRYEVQAVDKHGSRLLAVGTDIEPSSLALGAGTLYWTQGGTAMSATLS
jgi:hypothetical protein